MFNLSSRAYYNWIPLPLLLIASCLWPSSVAVCINTCREYRHRPDNTVSRSTEPQCATVCHLLCVTMAAFRRTRSSDGWTEGLSLWTVIYSIRRRSVVAFSDSVSKCRDLLTYWHSYRRSSTLAQSLSLLVRWGRPAPQWRRPRGRPRHSSIPQKKNSGSERCANVARKGT